MPRLVEAALVGDAGRDDRDLDRVEHAVAVFEVAEAVPRLARMQHPALRIGRELLAATLPRNATFLPAFALAPCPAFQVLKNHSPFSANCRCTRPIVWRNATASSIDSFVSVEPPGPSIIAAVMSFETMIGYSGEVDACIMNDSLKRECGIALRPSRMCRNDACESAASSL